MFGDFADAFHPDVTEARVRPRVDTVFDAALHRRGAGQSRG